jgi:hypothetical protein
MKGALLELTARGSEDANLIGNPQISFFKKVHKKYTNYSKFEVSHHFNGKLKFGEKIVCKIDKKGDLLSNMILQIILPDIPNQAPTENTTYVDAIGNFMIEEISFKMGGVTIDKLTSDYINIFYNNYYHFSKLSSYNKLIAKSPSAFTKTSNISNIELIVPLPFWFTKHVSQALPLLCLQYTEITIEVTFKKPNQCYCTFDDGTNSFITPTPPTTDITFTECNLFCDYIYLDTPERGLFLKQPQLTYLIEQTQENRFSVSAGQTLGNYELIFNHPVKELIMFYISDSNKEINRWNVYSNNTNIRPIKKIGLKFNGLDRFEPRLSKYFEYYQPISHHPSSSGDNIFYYSFAKNTYDYQPSGTCNFSKLDDVILHFEYNSNITAGEIVVYALNFNFLKIKSGMAGTIFS